MAHQIYESPPYGRFSLQTGAVWKEHIESGQVLTHHIDDLQVKEYHVDTGQLWNARMNQYFGQNIAIADRIPAFPPGKQLVHNLGVAPQWVSITERGGFPGAVEAQVFLTGVTMSSVFVYAEAGKSGVAIQWFVVR